MRIGMVMARHPRSKVSPIMPEVVRFLGERGATVETIHPEETLTDLSTARPEHDLYVLKSGTELALSLAGALHASGAAILNPFTVAAMCRDKVIATRVLHAAGVPVPETFVTHDPWRLRPLLDGGPLVVKPHRGAQGRGGEGVRDDHPRPPPAPGRDGRATDGVGRAAHRGALRLAGRAHQHADASQDHSG
jgi:ribosomal protein S6--L-glutamate ligase